ncbi:MAG: hypothetical protein JNM56_10290 [Planctomycetia bacterium]|nr:hypothetical protein [Planctomycetia bacterium]
MPIKPAAHRLTWTERLLNATRLFYLERGVGRKDQVIPTRIVKLSADEATGKACFEHGAQLPEDAPHVVYVGPYKTLDEVVHVLRNEHNSDVPLGHTGEQAEENERAIAEYRVRVM